MRYKNPRSLYFMISNNVVLQPTVMTKIRREYITNPDFDPAKVANASSAAEGLCKWVLAMEIYDRVAKIVAPKKERMQLAEGELQKTLDHLSKKRSELKAIEERLMSLKQQFQDMTEKKEKLELQVSNLDGRFLTVAYIEGSLEVPSRGSKNNGSYHERPSGVTIVVKEHQCENKNIKNMFYI